MTKRTTNRKKKTTKKAPRRRRKTQAEAIDTVVKITEQEALRFGKLDAEMRNHLQAIRISDLEYQAMKKDFMSRLDTKVEEKNRMKVMVSNTKPLYDALVHQLAETYGIKNPKAMSIDPDSRIIRDLSEELSEGTNT